MDTSGSANTVPGDALTLPPVHKAGTYFEYAQSPVALLAEATARGTGEDFVAFAQRELMDPLGIKAGSWNWTRDDQGRVLGYMGVQMRPDDYGRLGELLRRDGVWNGKRLVSEQNFTELTVPRITVAGDMKYGYGWFLRNWNGHKVVEHGGNIDVGIRTAATGTDDLVLMCQFFVNSLSDGAAGTD